ncbi:MAG: S41 family peptidase, partial [Anaerolineales bacterium]|nr:S41 family peptidase [Anaerolineales bacterium]
VGRATAPADAAAVETAPETAEVEVVQVTRVVTVLPGVEEEGGEASAASEASAAEAPTADSGDFGTADADAGATADAPEAPAAQQPQPELYTDIEAIDLELLYEAWDVLEEKFDGTLPPEEALINALIEGSLETLDDDYTVYVEPVLAQRLREDLAGAVSGIGAWVQENEEGLIEIVAPIEGQPAEAAGILPGDIIVEVDGASVVGMGVDEAVLLVRGPEGTEVTLTIARAGEPEPLTFTIVRTTFEVPRVEAEMLDSGIAYIRLTDFSQVAYPQLLEAFETLQAEAPQGLVLDLRNNPGGLVNQAMAIADLFLPSAVVFYERNNDGLDEVFRVDDGDAGETIPIVVLVNGASASASEIVAGALRDNGRAIIIGEQTFGKGSVQQIHTLSNGAELRVTIARWYTPENVSISENGLTPDIEVEAPADIEFGGENDTQLQRAIEYLLEGE